MLEMSRRNSKELLLSNNSNEPTLYGSNVFRAGDDTNNVENNVIDKNENRIYIKTERLTSKSNTKKGENIYSRLLRKHRKRVNFIIFLMICCSFIALGWVFGQAGPSLLDLQLITETSLEESSVFITASSIGYLLGVAISGAIFERMNSFLIIFIGLVMLSLSSAAIPFCTVYILMVFMQIVKGIGEGLVDAAGNSLLMLKFRDSTSSRSYMQTLHLSFAIGGILSPIATAPFLMQTTQMEENVTLPVNVSTVSKETNIEKGYVFSLYANEFTEISNLQIESTSLYPFEVPSQNSSILYRAYLITAGFCVLVSVPFFILFLFTLNETSRHHHHTTQDSGSIKRRSPLPYRIFILGFMCAFFALDNGIEDTYFGFFTTFTVKEYGWTKQEGSYAASVFWAAYAVGRFLAIFIVPHFKPKNLLKFYSILLISATTALFLSTVYAFYIGVWIFSAIIGFAISVFFPSLFIWTEEDFVSVTGRVASLLMFFSSFGSMVEPLLMGYLIENVSPMWFLYITTGQSLALFVMTWVASFQSRYVQRYNVISETDVPVTMMQNNNQ